MKTRRVVITGVAGFIGSNLADRLLREGASVAGIDNLAAGARGQVPEGVEFHQADIRDRGSRSLFRGADAVFHLAAKNCIADCQADPVETADINVTGTVNVLEACRSAGVKKTVIAESSALYEGSRALPTPEEEEEPRSFYAVSKSCGRSFSRAFERFHGLNLTSLRYFCVYGPRQDYRRTIPPVMSAFILKLLKGERPVIYGSGKKRRDFVYVDDVNDFHLQCLSDPRTDGGTYNVGSGTNHSVLEIYEIVESMLRTGIRPEFKPDLPGEAETTLADIRRAAALGWRPKTGIEEGLRRQVEHIRDRVLAPEEP
ncbi:MAG: hypothetical protein A2902_06120 [Elusimicrobia bacterium RIFCSPLOWO2_01_FULL_64_13]|nr:MAG: hypothetical protein A2902_06120 [Elusimicrobia bacterium RIFCSPLOWO2_01_FULL_64_13]